MLTRNIDLKKASFNTVFFVTVILLVLFSGCVNTVKTDNVKNNNVTSTQLQKQEPYKNFDIDLTDSSANIVYAQINDIMSEPEKYNGKTIKISGMFSAVYMDTQLLDLRFSCLVSDATVCCTQGIEFVPKDDLIFPDDYPYDYTKITVTGTLKKGQSDTPIYIADAQMQY